MAGSCRLLDQPRPLTPPHRCLHKEMTRSSESGSPTADLPQPADLWTVPYTACGERRMPDATSDGHCDGPLGATEHESAAHCHVRRLATGLLHSTQSHRDVEA